MASEPVAIEIQKRLQTKYDTILHFYFARKTRNYIRKKPKTHELLLFEDFLFYDCDDEFLKRPYKLHEIPDRIKLLAAYFKRNRVLPSETPFILQDQVRKLMDKRSRRRLKTNKKVKELDQADPFAGSGPFIESINTSQLEASENAFEENVSYQTRLYDIYSNSFSSQVSSNSLAGPHSVTLTSLMTLPIQQEEIQAKKFKDEEVDHLVWNFNDRDVERIVKEYNQLKAQENKGFKPEIKELNLKLNLSKLNKVNDEKNRREKTTYEKFYEEVRKKQEEKKPGKVYYVRGAQKNYQFTPRSPENEYITTREYENKQRIQTLGNDRLSSERIFVKTSLSPELPRPEDRFPPLYLPTPVDRQPSDRRDPEKIPSNRNTDRDHYDQPVLTDRTGERQNHYKRILDRMRENKKLEMQVRGNSAASNANKQEKSRRIQRLKEKAAQLLSSSKAQARLYESPQHCRNSNTYK